MARVIDAVPTSFEVAPFGGQWFAWAEIAACFWPGRSRRADKVNPKLAPVRELGGVYCFAWSPQAPPLIDPKAPQVKYIGETRSFLRRMGQFGHSAGFWNKRQDGHSAGWRWPEGRTECAWVAFFPVGQGLLPHLASGMRHWMEAVALEEHRLANGRLPEVNEPGSGVVAFD
ncbi:MAG: hypothetical protein HS116_21080 [Planctomycetes bacterium]|nr:hypothetical protein [Planctomycetota bacterium]